MSQLPLTFQATAGLSLACISGQVSLFRFIQAPPPGSVIGQITPLGGRPIPLVQTQPTPLGGIPLASVDGQFATVCGPVVRVGRQTAIDVRVVNPGAPSPTGTPTQPIDLRLLLLLLRGIGGLGPGQFGLGVAQGLAQTGLGAGQIGLGVGQFGQVGLGTAGLGGLLSGVTAAGLQSLGVGLQGLTGLLGQTTLTQRQF